ncbi:MAG: hypothetical protein ACO3FK_04010 [Vulcanococcus sp.]
MGGRSSHTPWGFKVQRTISVSDEAWTLWTGVAEASGINRSELFEVLARSLESLEVPEIRSTLLAEIKES